MLQFRVGRVKFMSDRETHRIYIVCPDATEWVIQFMTEDDDQYFNLECVLMYLAEWHSDVIDTDTKVLNIMRDLQYTAERHGITYHDWWRAAK